MSDEGYEGKLKISPELRASEIGYLNKILGEDIRDFYNRPNSPWINNDRFKELEEKTYFIDLELTNDFSSLEMGCTEKIRGVLEQINYIISYMREKNPEFSLSGMIHYSYDVGEIAKIIPDPNGDGYFKEIRIRAEGDIVCCPNCEEEFLLKDEHRVERAN